MAAAVVVGGDGCGGVGDGDVGGGGGAPPTPTLASRAPASRSTASGISAVWPRPTARPRTMCLPWTGRDRHRPASVTSGPSRSSVTRRPTRAAGRGTRWAYCACAAPTAV